MDVLTGKPIAAVRIEGTLADKVGVHAYEFGDVKPGAREKLQKLRDKGYHVILVSACANHYVNHRHLLNWVVQQRVPYDDIWGGYGLPDAEVWIDDTAVKLEEKDD